ncbi:MAG: patatin-like phospholipase family protein, partial [Anaerolineales bacterium]|nr:patatin-like phospholipase family protein [Anaerolineales bacterium]
RALVLSGGGGRGAYHVGALRFLEENEWFPDVVVGTSIGAVNGAALASGHNAHSLWSLWRRLETRDVQKININPFKGNFLLDTMPLRETLKTGGWINFDRVNSAEAAVDLRITAMEVATGRLRVFGNSADAYPGKMERIPLTLDHIIASCSIPIVYPATELDGQSHWDGGTVANTPLSPAIDAGAEEIVVVLMTPWDDDPDPEDDPTGKLTPGNLLHAAGAAFEWALLASFQADLKMFRRINELVNLRLENARLQAANRVLEARLAGREIHLPDLDGDGIPDILQGAARHLPEPVIIAPKRPLPVEQIIQYKHDRHEYVYNLGYEDARRAWQAAGRVAEGWATP